VIAESIDMEVERRVGRHEKRDKGNVVTAGSRKKSVWQLGGEQPAMKKALFQMKAVERRRGLQRMATLHEIGGSCPGFGKEMNAMSQIPLQKGRQKESAVLELGRRHLKEGDGKRLR